MTDPPPGAASCVSLARFGLIDRRIARQGDIQSAPVISVSASRRLGLPGQRRISEPTDTPDCWFLSVGFPEAVLHSGFRAGRGDPTRAMAMGDGPSGPAAAGPDGGGARPDVRPGHRRRASVRRGPEESENGRRSSPCRGGRRPVAGGRPGIGTRPWVTIGRWGRRGRRGPGGRSQWPGIGTAIIPRLLAQHHRNLTRPGVVVVRHRAVACVA